MQHLLGTSHFRPLLVCARREMIMFMLGCSLVLLIFACIYVYILWKELIYHYYALVV